MQHHVYLLILNGAVVLSLGNLYGFFFGRAIGRRHSPERQRARRVAHTGVAAGGALLLAVAPALAVLAAPAAWEVASAWAFIAGAWGFAVALPVAAATGHRGLGPGRSLAAAFVFAGNVVGAGGSLMGGLILVGAALAAPPLGALP